MFHMVARELAPCYCGRGVWCCRGARRGTPVSRAIRWGKVRGSGFAELRNRTWRSCVMVLGRASSVCFKFEEQFWRARCKRSSGDPGVSRTISNKRGAIVRRRDRQRSGEVGFR
jgi:hypothetical protein